MNTITTKPINGTDGRSETNDEWERSFPARRRTRDFVREDLGRLRDMLYKHFLLVYGGFLLFLLIVLFFEVLPSQQLAFEREKTALTPKEFYELSNGIHQTFTQAVGGAILLIGLYFTARTLWTTQEGQITDRFTKAVDQLGKTGPENLAIRLGGIYALERIARDSERDHGPIMEILTAYAREHAPWPAKRVLADDLSLVKRPSAENDQPSRKPAADIQAILTVLGRRVLTHEGGQYVSLDLRNTDLRGADLRSAHLEHADMGGANLEGANLSLVHLQWAFLTNTILKKVDLELADLEGALFVGANFQGANLKGANLTGADLITAQNLTVEQLTTAKSRNRTMLSSALQEQLDRTMRS
jgi:hypothetical protein